MSYRVTTQAYSGPFDLLLQLVSRQKVDIGAVSISEVAEQYLAEVRPASRRPGPGGRERLRAGGGDACCAIKAASLTPGGGRPSRTQPADEDLDEYADLVGRASCARCWWRA